MLMNNTNMLRKVLFWMWLTSLRPRGYTNSNQSAIWKRPSRLPDSKYCPECRKYGASQTKTRPGQNMCKLSATNGKKTPELILLLSKLQMGHLFLVWQMYQVVTYSRTMEAILVEDSFGYVHIKKCACGIYFRTKHLLWLLCMLHNNVGVSDHRWPGAQDGQWELFVF